MNDILIDIILPFVLVSPTFVLFLYELFVKCLLLLNVSIPFKRSIGYLLC
jgi:hypothetical protein